jgi:hypothetical protein
MLHLPDDVVSTEIKKKKQECKKILHSPVDLDPLTAASAVQTLLKLSDEEKEKLHSELLQTSEDPILALRKLTQRGRLIMAQLLRMLFSMKLQDLVYRMERGVMKNALVFYSISELYMNCVHAELLSCRIIKLHLLLAPNLLLGWDQQLQL